MFLNNVSHIYCLYSCDTDINNFFYKEQNVSLIKYKTNSKFFSFKYFRYIAIYNSIIDAYNKGYETICFLYPDVKLINENIEENINLYNVFCLNPHDVNNDCLILNKFVIEYIAKYIKTPDFKDTFWLENVLNLLNDNFKIYYPKNNYVKHKVDYVLTYVNNNDDNWLINYKNKFNTNIIENISRFNDYGTLEELILGIRKYASFIDDIFIVVQNKSEVNISLDNIKIVEHHEIIPNNFLPTFNSCTIEMFIGNIKGLSEYFIYGNDDMFFINNVEESDFFDKGKLCLSLDNLSVDTMYQNVVKNSFSLFVSEFNKQYMLDSNLGLNAKTLKHVPHPMRKSSCIHIYDTYKNTILSTISELRAHKNLNQYIYCFYDYFIQNTTKSPIKNKYMNDSFDKNELNKEIQILCVNKIDYPHKLKSYLRKNLNKEISVALCAIAKNENLYIREWVEHYKNLGIDKIFLYDNNDIDGEIFEEVINDYIESGYVEVIDVRGIWPSQIESYNNFYHSNKSSEFDWILYCDIDEFLEMDNKFSNINQYLNQSHFNEFDVIKICWKCFDDNDLVYVKDNDYSIKRFTRAQKNTPWTNSQTKMFIKTNLNIIINSPHGALETNEINKHLNVCNSKGEKMNRNNISYDAGGIKFKHDDCWLNHYRCKTIEEYVVKAKRGWPTIYKNGGKQYMNARFFFIFNSYSREKHKHFAKLLEKEYKSITSWGSILQNRNWGDDINFSFLPELFDFNFEFIIANKNLNEPNYACIGSIINDNFITKNTVIWGAGIDSESTNLTIKPKEVLAVRGPLTRKKLLELNIECPEVYGDPALLIHKFYKPDIDKQYKLGIIPHFSNLNDKNLINLKNPQIKILNLKHYNNNWKNIVDDILKCEYIISESLHGIILAEQFNIPNIWINIKDTKEKNKGIFKYLDFYESIGKTDIKNFIKINDYNNIEEIIDIINSTYYTKFEIDLDKLINVCPLGKITNTNLLNDMKSSKDI